MRRVWLAYLAGGAALAGGLVIPLYLWVVRPWQLHWGATDEEITRALPGDGIVPDPSLIATRAVTIAAPVEAVWPWLVQMGYRRAGWYSYDWIDNAGIHVRRIIPELQHLSVGDMMLTSPEGGFRVEGIAPYRHLVLAICGTEPGARATISTAIILDPLDARHTRLIMRLRGEFHGVRAGLFGLAMDFGDFIMMRKQLIGIKERAEALAARQVRPDVAIAGTPERHQD